MLAQRDDAQADALYEQAAAASPEHPLAQLMWGYRLALQKQPVPNLTIAQDSSAVRRWRNFINQAERTDAVEQEIAAIAVLIKIVPDERIQALKYADLLFQTERREEAFARYNQLAQVDDIWGLLAGGRYAQLSGQEAEATAMFIRATPLAPDESSATRVADALRNLGDAANARLAYERALEMSTAAIPETIRPILASGLALRSSDPDAAQRAYEQARELAPESGYPDYAIGRMLLERNDPAGAIPFFEAAMQKQPTVRLYGDVRDRAAYEANLTTPGTQN